MRCSYGSSINNNTLTLHPRNFLENHFLNLKYNLSLDEIEARLGCTKTIQFEREDVCMSCRGTGKLLYDRTCVACNGRGCLEVKRHLKVHIPAGVKNGDLLPIKNEGIHGANGVRGDLYIEIKVKDKSGSGTTVRDNVVGTGVTEQKRSSKEDLFNFLRPSGGEAQKRKVYLKNIIVNDDPNKSFIKEIKFRLEGASEDITKYAVILPIVNEVGVTTNRYQFYVNNWQVSMTSPELVQIEFTVGDQISVRQINGKYAGKAGITTMEDAGFDPQNEDDLKAYFVITKKSPEELIVEWGRSFANYRKIYAGRKIDNIVEKSNVRIMKNEITGEYHSVGSLLIPNKSEILTEQVLEYVNKTKAMSISDFIRLWTEKKQSKVIIPGCYVIYDEVEQKIYVGQAKNVYGRVKEHIDGRSLYSKKPQMIDKNLCELRHSALIRIIPAFDAGFSDLNEMERVLIAAYDCIEPKGYNLTKGNG